MADIVTSRVSDILYDRPQDVWIDIVQFLDIRSMHAMSAINLAWYHFCNDRVVRVHLSFCHLRHGLSPLQQTSMQASDIDHYFHLLVMGNDLRLFYVGLHMGWCYLSRTLSNDHSVRSRWEQVIECFCLIPENVAYFSSLLYVPKEWPPPPQLGGRRLSFSVDRDDRLQFDFFDVFVQWHKLPTVSPRPNSFTDEVRRACLQLIEFGAFSCRHWISYVDAFERDCTGFAKCPQSLQYVNIFLCKMLGHLSHLENDIKKTRGKKNETTIVHADDSQCATT